MAGAPDFITHYYLPDRRPFMNLSDLDDGELASVLSGLDEKAAAGLSQRRFGPRYMPLRSTQGGFGDDEGRPLWRGG